MPSRPDGKPVKYEDFPRRSTGRWGQLPGGWGLLRPPAGPALEMNDLSPLVARVLAARGLIELTGWRSAVENPVS
jgi:hypothetical protein